MSGTGNFTPIGLYSDDNTGFSGNKYCGTFDGDGHTISNLHVEVTTVNGATNFEAGFISRLHGGTVKNLVLKDITVVGHDGRNHRTGGLVGLSYAPSGTTSLVQGCAVINANLSDANNVTTAMGGITGAYVGGAYNRCYTNYSKFFGTGSTVSTHVCCFENVSSALMTSGMLCYQLNNTTTTPTNLYRQTLNSQSYPVPTGDNTATGSSVFVTYNNNGLTIANSGTSGGISASVNINSAAKLRDLATMVSLGYHNINVTLTSNIDYSSYTTAADMIGSAAHPYSGNFNANGYTVNVAFNTSEEYAALFRYLDGATIHGRLHVTGSVTTSAKYAAGVAARLDGSASTFDEVWSQVTINSSLGSSSSHADGTHGGLVGVADANASFTACFFNGNFVGANTKCWGGLVGWTGDGKTLTINNCYLNLAASSSYDATESATWARGLSGILTGSNNCHTFTMGTTWSAARTLTTDAVTSGELCWYLNGGTINGNQKWNQRIAHSSGNDNIPVWASYRANVVCPSTNPSGYGITNINTVYQGYDHGSSTLVYRNRILHTTAGPHHSDSDFSNGVYHCSVCDTTIYTQPSGSGTSESPYLIANPGNLRWFANLQNSSTANAGLCARLTADINMNGIPWNKTKAIGYQYWYSGDFDGNGHKITNLNTGDGYQNKAAALFCVVQNGGHVHDLTVENAEVSSTEQWQGIMARRNYGGTIERCMVIGGTISINGNQSNLAGFVGTNEANGVIRHCGTVGVNVNRTNSSYHASAFVDNNYSGCTIEYCYAKNINASGCSNIWFTAYQSGNSHDNYLSWGNTSGITQQRMNSNNAATEAPTSWDETTILLNGCSSASTVVWRKGTSDGYPLPTGPNSGSIIYIKPNDSNCSTYEYTNTAPSITTLSIDNESALFTLGKLVRLGYPSNITVNLTNDINNSYTDYTGQIGTAINPFKGTFNGNGHTITVAFNTSEQQSALFRYTDGATISNLHTSGTVNTSAKFAAGVIGRNVNHATTLSSVSSDVTISSTVSGDGSHGGLVAVAMTAVTFNNCAFYGTFSGSSTTNWGGFVGWAEGTAGSCTINNSYFALNSGSNASNSNSSTFSLGSAPTLTNSYYLTAFGTAQGTATTAAQMSSGELCYLLNGSQDAGIWRQKLSGEGVNTNPVLKQTDDNNVYYGYADCEATEQTYSNHVMHATQGHHFENGVCTNSGCTDHQLAYLVPTYNTTGTSTSGIASWSTQTVVTSNAVTSSANQVQWGAAGQDSWYFVSGNVTLTKGAVCSGNVHLILCDGASLTVNNSTINQAGINVTGTNSLTIYAQSEGNGMGALSATGGEYAAGIGGGYNQNGQNITINGGTVTATGAYGGAGIGGGNGCSGQNITINGGIVTANGSSNSSGNGAAGIGGGFYSSGQNITINGGTVTANGDGGGAGIGGGHSGNGFGQYITINGGTVTANGGSHGAGIGGGFYNYGRDIAINGGIVTANGGVSAAGIGSGDQGSTSSNILISTTLTTKAGYSTNPTGVITNNTPNTDLASALSGGEHRYVTVHQHGDGTPSWVWADDGSEATLTIHCSFDNGDVVLNTSSTPAVAITSSTTATCTSAGTTTYNASVTYNGTTYNAPAKEVATNAVLYYTLNDNTRTATVFGSAGTGRVAIARTESSTSIAIPATVTHNGTYYSVTEVGYMAFCSSTGDFNNLTSVTIPNSVTSIAMGAFISCTGLTSVSIGTGVDSILNNPFVGCTNLTNITVDAGNTTYDSRSNCNAIIKTADNTLVVGCKTSTIPATVTTIGNYAFIECTGLTSLNFENNSQLTSIGSQAFDGCIDLGTISLPGSVESIGGSAFNDCSSLYSVTFADNSQLTTIGSSAFSGCTSLSSVDFGDNSQLTTIDESAFSSCTSLSTITLPGSVQSIGEQAFSNCTSLSSVEFHSIPQVGSDAFISCSSLTYKTLALSDGSYVSDNDLPALSSNPTYSRTMTSRWETLVLPFDISVDGTEVYQVFAATAIGGSCTKTPLTRSIDAGTPLLLHLNDGVQLPYSLSIEAYRTDVSTSTRSQTTSVSGLNLIGSYEQRNLSSTNGYVLENGVFVRIGNATNAAVGPFRAYVSGTGAADTYPLYTGHNFDANGECTVCHMRSSVTYRVPTYNTAGAPASGIASWSTGTAQNVHPVTSSTEQVTLYEGWYYVSGNVTLSKGAVCNGNVHLILCDGANLTAEGQEVVDAEEGGAETIYHNHYNAGITVQGNSSLTIYAQSDGTGMGALSATGNGNAAGIGSMCDYYSDSENDSYSGYNSGSITINGGNVTANGVSWAAGIGGGYKGHGQNITINGGTVTANGGDYAAGIGGGKQGNGQNITINGGNVTANGGEGAAGIGGGGGGDVGDFGGIGQNITINGGTVTATGNRYGAAIGSGVAWDGDTRNYATNASNIKISTACGIKAGSSENSTSVINNNTPGTDLASALAGEDHRYVSIHQHTFDANGVCTHEGCGAVNGYVLDKSLLVDWIRDNCYDEDITQYTLHFVNSISQAQGSVQTSLNSDGTIKLYCQYTGGSSPTGANLYVAPTTAGKTIYAPADCSEMFSGNSKLTSVTFDNFNTSLVTNMYNLFNYCQSLTSLDLSNFNTANAMYIGGMFNNCSNLASLDLSGFNTEHVTSMDYMFTNCSALTTIAVGSGFVTTAVTSSMYMFFGCSALVGGMGTAYNEDNVTATYAHYDGGTANPGYFSPAPVTIDKDLLDGELMSIINNSNSDFTLTFAYAAPAGAEANPAQLNGANTIRLYKVGTDYTVAPVASGAAIMAPADCNSLFTMAGSHLTSLDLSNFNTANVTTMEGLAYGCSNLTSVTIGRSMTTIGVAAFGDCTNLANITVAAGNATYDSRNSCNAIIRTADNTLVAGCRNTVIPSTVTSIGNSAFNSCTGLTSISIPSGVTSIGNWAFQGCSGLTSITIPNTVTSIGKSAFDGCSVLQSITIPSGVTAISEATFRYCSALTSITIPSTVTSIGNYAFNGCTGLQSMKVLATTPPALGDDAFEGVTTSISVKVPSASLSAYTNYNNTNQPWGGFTNISALPDLYYEFNDTNLTATVYGTQDENSTRTAIALEDEGTSIVIPSTVTSGGNTYTVTGIGASAFLSNTTLTGISIPGTVTSIGMEAFSGCSQLNNVIIPGTVTSIGNGSFEGCSNLANFTFQSHSSFPTIGQSAFLNCTSLPVENGLRYADVYLVCVVDPQLTTAVIREGTMVIGKLALASPMLTSVTIPSSVTTICAEAFALCENISLLVIPSTVTTIGRDAFMGRTIVYNGNATYEEGNENWGAASRITDLYTENGLTYTASDKVTLLSCATTATAVTIPNTVQTIMGNAFNGCTALTSVTFADNSALTTINANAFQGCTGLFSITIPSGVSTIGENAFYGIINVAYNGSCGSSTDKWGALYRNHYVEGDLIYTDNNKTTLVYCRRSATSVTIPNTVTSIGAEAFSGCTGLTSITIPGSVTRILDQAFAGCTGLTSMTVQAAYPPNMSSNAFNGVTVSNITVTVPCSVVSNYESNNNWSSFTYQCQTTLYYTFDNEQHTATVYGNQDSNNPRVELSPDGNGADITIPSTVTYNNATYTVTAIGELAFSGYNKTTSVSIPDGVTSIGISAFKNCSRLQSITLPGTVTSIGDDSFYGCSSLQSINIPAGVTSIEGGTFRGCSSLQSINIPAGVTSIGYYAFQGCTGLTTITVESGNTFYDSRNNSNAIIKTADNTLIAGCKTTTIPSGVTTIGAGSFHGHTGLTSINIPSGVTSIDVNAFKACTGLQSVTLPSTLTTIEGAAFYGCTGLQSLTVKAATPPTLYTNAFDSVPNTCTLQVLCDCVETYQSASGWGTSNFTYGTCLPSHKLYYEFVDNGNTHTATVYGQTTYYQGSNTLVPIAQEGDGTSVTIPSTVTHNGTTYTVTTIGNAAFEVSGNNAPWYNLQSVNIPSGVTTIGDEAFFDCGSLQSVNIPNTVTSIGRSAFCMCSSLQSVNIPASVTSIGNEAFISCGLTSVSIPASVTSIGEGAFGSNSGITSISVDANNQHYYSSANGTDYNAIITRSQNGQGETLIAACKNSTIPGTVTSIGKYAFAGCTGLTSINIPDGVTSIGESAFNYCTDLTSINIPDGVTSIGNYAFNGCSNLKTVYNLSGLTITKGADGYGYVAKYADRVIDGNVFTKTGTGANALYQITNSSYSVVDNAGSTETNIPESTIPTNFIYKVSSGSKTDQWKAKKIVLKDDTCRFNAPVVFTADTAVYTRTFADSNRSTLCLPFTVAKPDGFEVYEFKEFTSNTLKFQPLPADSSIRANKPYLVGKNLTKTTTTTFTFIQSGAKFPATPATMPKDSSNYMTFQGTMARTGELSTNCYGYKDGYFVRSGGQAHVNPFRCYFTYCGTQSGSPSLGIDITDGDYLGIDDVEAEPEPESRIYYSTDVYDLMGRIVRKNAENLNGLPRGIYIWKGKKIIHMN